MTRSALIAGMLVFFVGSPPTAASDSGGALPLPVSECVQAQYAIEGVYWRHRTWPEQNAGPKPPLAAVLSAETVRTKVRDSVLMSKALEAIWSQPLTKQQLEAEADRIIRETKRPAMLQEVLRSLGGRRDLFVECLARPTLVDRLVRERYADDPHIHAGTKARAQAARTTASSFAALRALADDFTEVVLTKEADCGRGDGLGEPDPSGRVCVTAEEWEALAAEGLPPGGAAAVSEDDSSFYVRSILPGPDGTMYVSTARWTKRPFDKWWAEVSGALGSGVDGLEQTLAATDVSFGASPLDLAASNALLEPMDVCTPDTWTPTNTTGAPTARRAPIGVWTGTEMVVWGGYSASLGFQNTGGRYDPLLDSWQPTSTGPNCPASRFGHTAVWTGTEVLIWGGYGASFYTQGGRYNPASNSWASMSTAETPIARFEHTAVWTGTEMIVWGGNQTTGDPPVPLGTGGRYSPSTNSWAPTPAGPLARHRHSAVATGSNLHLMIVWGGDNGSQLSDGSRFDWIAGSWSPTSAGPEARHDHSAVWNGSQMIVWGGGLSGNTLNTGSRYDPTSNTWQSTSTAAPVPQSRHKHSAVWAAEAGEMIVWGGYDGGWLNSGGRYNPLNNSWQSTSVGANVPDPRYMHAAAWTGSEMTIWGGYRYLGQEVDFASGGRYCVVGCTLREWFRDSDSDTWGDASESRISCDPPGIDWWDNIRLGDCNDQDDTMYPGAPQRCDGKNNDCNDPSWPAVPPDEANQDGDAYEICAGDCNDGDASVYPGAPQLCDGKNNNCSDPGWPALPPAERDADSDGFRICTGDCDDTRAQVNPGRIEGLSAPGTCSDGLDNDCDGKTDAAEAGCLVPLYDLAALVDYYRRPDQVGGEQWAEGITVELLTAPSQAFVGRALTKANGEALFTGLESGSYVLKPHRTEPLPAPAVTPADAALVVSAWLGTVDPLVDPIQRKAADVDRDGQAGISDASLIMRHWLGRVGRFPAAAALSPPSDLGFEPPTDTTPVPSDGPSRFMAYCFGDVNSDWWTQPAQGGAIAGTAVWLGPALSADETDGGGETTVLLEGAELPLRDESQTGLQWVDAGARLYRVAGPARALRSVSITDFSPTGDESDAEAAAQRVVWSSETPDRPAPRRSERQRILFRSSQPTYSLALVLRLAPGSREPRPVLEPPFADWVVVSHFDEARRELRIAAFGVANPLPAGRHTLSLALDGQVSGVLELSVDEGRATEVKLGRSTRVRDAAEARGPVR